MVRTDEEIFELHRLRKLYEECSRIGEYKRMKTEDMQTISNEMKKAADALLMFPTCECARDWCLRAHLSLEDIIRRRTNKTF